MQDSDHPEGSSNQSRFGYQWIKGKIGGKRIMMQMCLLTCWNTRAVVEHGVHQSIQGLRTWHPVTAVLWEGKKKGEGDRSKQLGTLETCHSDSFDCFCWEGPGTSLVALQGMFAWPSDLANLKMPSAGSWETISRLTLQYRAFVFS